MTRAPRLFVQTSAPKQWYHRFGWFFLILGCGSLLYFHAMKQKEITYCEMMAKLHELEKEKASALMAQDELLLQIQSQSDPAWVEMVLKRNLGMIREGQVKVYFHHNP